MLRTDGLRADLRPFLLLAILLCLGGLNRVHAEESAAASVPAAKLVVGFAQDNLANDWRLAQVEGVKKGLAPYPHIKFIYTDGKGSTAQQIQDVEDLLYSGIDILITSPRDGSAMTPIVTRAYKMGIPVILLTRRIDNNAYTTFISPDDEAIARDAARYIADKRNGKANVLMLQGVPSATTAKIRTDAFISELKNYPEMKLVAVKVANYLRSDAIRAIEEVLQQGIPFDAIYSQSDSMASGARIALNKAGIAPDSILTVGIDYIGEAREAIRRGQQSASYTYPTCADEAVNVILRIADGQSVPKSIRVPSQRVTRDNVEQIEPIF
jgi:ribose transport system substrate-binding protein